jgi:phytol kinase
MVLPSWLAPPFSFGFQAAVVLAWLGVVGGTAEWLHRRKLATPEVVRKVVHIGVGHVILLAWWLQVPAWMGIGASLFFSIVAYLSYRYPLLPSINSIGRKSLGTFFYAVSIGVLVAWFWPLQQPQYAALGILIMAWGDGLAALIGQRFGRHPYHLWGMQKSWEGSFTMFVLSGALAGVILGCTGLGWGWQTGVISVIVAFIATGLEAFSNYGVDNLTVPVGSAALAFGLVTLLI